MTTCCSCCTSDHYCIKNRPQKADIREITCDRAFSPLNVLVIVIVGNALHAGLFLFHSIWSDVIIILHNFCVMYAMYERLSWLCLVCWCMPWKSSRCQHFSVNTSQRHVLILNSHWTWQRSSSCSKTKRLFKNVVCSLLRTSVYCLLLLPKHKFLFNITTMRPHFQIITTWGPGHKTHYLFEHWCAADKFIRTTTWTFLFRPFRLEFDWGTKAIIMEMCSSQKWATLLKNSEQNLNWLK